MSHKVCNICGKAIRDRDELLTASKWFRIKSFHVECFEEMEKEETVARNMWIPVNGTSGNISFILMLALATWMLFTETLGYLGDLIGIIALYPIILRVISFLFIEYKLPKFIADKKPLNRE
ncbi:hypothetical protein [Salinibacillus xinjiangensis]|uniref:Permease n=1 Tax=Salinibacillus xinjiangensis TaxID=1229268 RepID=A0A6G1X7C8_9BACI|nr:hypothetical protein [Salinibacillus xinjiangensis]MRG86842.1 hypothetical protein [Salinibacillus xinjiangensis]